IYQQIQIAKKTNGKICLIGAAYSYFQTLEKLHKLDLPSDVFVQPRNLARSHSENLTVIVTSKQSDNPQYLLDMLQHGYQGFRLHKNDQLIISTAAGSGVNWHAFASEFSQRGV